MTATEQTATPGQRINIPTVPNLRDIGGYAATGGRVRTGQLYRSTDLTHLGGDDLPKFAALGIRTVFDLRTEPERAAEPDVVPKGTEQVVCDVLKGAPGAAPAQMIQAISDPAAAAKMFGGDKALQLFEGGYRQNVSLPSALTAYREFFTRISDDPQRPALFHCTTGKDRTGWAAASTLMLLGVSEKDVFYDYELTNRDLLPALKPLFEHFRAAGGDPDVLKPVLGVQAAYLEASLDEMTTKFGSIEGYFGDGLGIDADGQQRLRDALIDSEGV